MTEAVMNDQALYEAILAGMGDALHKPTDAVPSVRCLSRSTLNDVIREQLRNVDVPKSRCPTISSVIDHLTRSHLLQTIPFDDASARVGLKRLYALGLGTSAETIHPVELLQAHAPDGIVCYMSAFETHELTTQPITHHHIARFKSAVPRLTTSSIETTTLATPPVGQWQFTFQGLRYYLTHRDPQYLQGFQTRYLDDKCRYKVTTLEQTLLDTLHRPMNCGGPAVVFEAWETAAERLELEKLVQLLNQIGDPRLIRRAGYMLEKQGIDGLLGGDFKNEHPLPLLVGVPFSNFNKRWGLLVP